MPNFKRENDLVSRVNDFAETIENEEVNSDVLKLIRNYENATFAEWGDKDDFEARTISRFVNDCGFPDDEIAEYMATEHRTIQQSFMRLCMKFIKKMSEQEYWDGRNEASVKMAKKIMEALDNNIGLPCV